MPVPYKRAPISKITGVIGSYKSAITRKINQINHEFNWQKSFYNHIIRNDKSLHRIRKYIHFNAVKWEYDQENQDKIPLKQKKEILERIFLRIISTKLSNDQSHHLRHGRRSH